MKRALVLGAGGFIGNHLVNRLKKEGYWVRGVDLKTPEFSKSIADEFIVGDLTRYSFTRRVVEFSSFYSQSGKQYCEQFDEIYQLAADMGGAGYIFSGDNDANVMQNSASINLNILKAVTDLNKFVSSDWYINSRICPFTYLHTKIFYSSSACMYPEHNQLDPDNPNCAEDSAYPANPDSEYGWEKLFSERLYLSYNRNFDIPVRIARFHNIYGPLGTWNGGKEKAPAAICRKVLLSDDSGEIEIWGDGSQTRSFLYIDECIEGIMRLMASEFSGPVNIGSEEMVTINQLVDCAEKVGNKKLKRVYKLDAPLGVRGRNSDNRLIKEKIGWEPSFPLINGIEKTYNWISKQIN
jgi:GDP-D-mannose 3', 5'-epimerase